MITNIIAIVTLFFLSFNLICSKSIFNGLVDSLLPDHIFALEFSPDQNYMAIVVDSFIQINNGVTMDLIYGTIPLGYYITAFSFSQDSHHFVIGLRNKTGLDASFRIYKSVSPDPSTISFQESHSESVLISADGSINFACYTADSSYIVFATSTELFVKKINGTGGDIIYFDKNLPITRIACSATNNFQFAVSGSVEGMPSKIKIYVIDNTTNSITQQRIIDLTNPNQHIEDMQYSHSGNFLYRGGANLYKIDLATWEEFKINIPSEYTDFRKIRVTNKEDIIAVSTNTSQLFVRKTVPGANVDQDQVEAIYNWNFALAPHGATVFFIQNSSSGTLASQCSINQFLNSLTDTCEPCSTNCTICLDSGTSCRSCPEANYLSVNYQCLSCSSHCQRCANGSVCIACYDPFIKKQNQSCGCQDGKFPNGSICSNCIITNCKTCSSAQKCETCDDTFSITSTNLCACAKGKFLHQNKCVACAQNCVDCLSLQKCKQCGQKYHLINSVCDPDDPDGFPIWAIVLVSMLGVGVLLVIGCALLSKMRKTKKITLLTEEDGDSSERID